MLALTAVISLLTAAVFGILPVAFARNRGLSSAIVQGSRTAMGGGRRFRNALIVSEVALALVLLSGAGLTVRTLLNLRAIDLGFSPEGLFTAATELPFPKYNDRTRRDRFFESVLERIEQLPGVVSAGYASDLPFLSRGNTQSFVIAGRQPLPGQNQTALFRVVSNGYLQTMRARIKEGRFLSNGDRQGAPPVVVINETFARAYWPGESPLGKRIRMGRDDEPWLTIVGVVRDIRERGLEYSMQPGVYVPFLQSAITYFLPSDLAVRTTLPPRSLANEIQRAVWSVDRDQPVSRILTMDEIVDADIGDHRRQTMLLGGFAALALILSTLGVYSVLSYSIAQRTREIGLRMAIGASRRDVIALVVREGMALVGAGLAIGVSIALLATRFMSAILYGVSTSDPATLIVVVIVLCGVAFGACYVPAKRASGLDPMVALRLD